MKEHYTPDQLQQPVEILRKSRVADGAGGFTETEASQGTHMAFVRNLRGQERYTGEQVQSNGGLLFVFYAAIGVLATDVLVYAGVRYNVASILPPGLSQFREVEATSGGIV